jgi:hypothetical protein
VRVAELEKEIKALRHRFEGRREPGIRSESPNSAEGSQDVSRSSAKNPIDAASVPNRPLDRVLSTIGGKENEDDDTDEIEVDDATADLLFTKYKTDLFPHFPFIYFSDDTPATHLRDTRPILFNAILAASAASLHSPLGEALFHKAERLYAHHVFMEGNKSLELVQALILTALWYHPPDRFSHHKFTTYAHLATNMALDTRLGRGRSAVGRSSGIGEYATYDKADGQRALLACYVTCST